MKMTFRTRWYTFSGSISLIGQWFKSNVQNLQKIYRMVRGQPTNKSDNYYLLNEFAFHTVEDRGLNIL